MRSIALPINKPALGIRGLTITLDADPETGRVSFALKGAPITISDVLDPEDIRQIGVAFEAEGLRGMQLRGDCVGLSRICGNCQSFSELSRCSATGVCLFPGRMADAVMRDRAACASWEMAE